MLPFGYANFGPLLTAILTCVLLVLGIILVLGKKERMREGIKVVSAIAVVTSLMPLLYGFDYFSIVGTFISFVLIIEFVLTFKV